MFIKWNPVHSHACLFDGEIARRPLFEALLGHVWSAWPMFIVLHRPHPADKFSEKILCTWVKWGLSLVSDCLLFYSCDQAMQMCSSFFFSIRATFRLFRGTVKKGSHPVPNSNECSIQPQLYVPFFFSQSETLDPQTGVIPHDKAWWKSVSSLSHCHFANRHKVLFD